MQHSSQLNLIQQEDVTFWPQREACERAVCEVDVVEPDENGEALRCEEL